jgi:hypothetical protein
MTANSAGDTARVLLSGFSYHEIRDDRVVQPMDRVEHLLDVLRWLDNEIDDPTAIPDVPDFANGLAQNYPNPFNPTTRIKYGLPESARVRVTIYNVLGQLVSTIIDKDQAAGYYEVNWDAQTDAGATLPSGLYFYRVETKNFSATRSMVFQK